MARTGRPRDSCVWKYFKHDEETKMSVCLVGAELLRKETVVSKSRKKSHKINLKNYILKSPQEGASTRVQSTRTRRQ